MEQKEKKRKVRMIKKSEIRKSQYRGEILK